MRGILIFTAAVVLVAGFSTLGVAAAAEDDEEACGEEDAALLGASTTTDEGGTTCILCPPLNPHYCTFVKCVKRQVPLVQSRSAAEVAPPCHPPLLLA